MPSVYLGVLMQSVYLTRRTILLAAAIAITCSVSAYLYWDSRSVVTKTPHVVIESDGRAEHGHCRVWQ